MFCNVGILKYFFFQSTARDLEVICNIEIHSFFNRYYTGFKDVLYYRDSLVFFFESPHGIYICFEKSGFLSIFSPTVLYGIIGVLKHGIPLIFSSSNTIGKGFLYRTPRFSNFSYG